MGAITLDNQGYGRYQGEIQICKTTLQSNPKVNVIGHVIANDLSMLVLIKRTLELNLNQMKEINND